MAIFDKLGLSIILGYFEIYEWHRSSEKSPIGSIPMVDFKVSQSDENSQLIEYCHIIHAILSYIIEYSINWDFSSYWDTLKTRNDIDPMDNCPLDLYQLQI